MYFSQFYLVMQNYKFIFKTGKDRLKICTRKYRFLRFLHIKGRRTGCFTDFTTHQPPSHNK